MEQILLAYGIKETVAAITILYRNFKVKVHSVDRPLLVSLSSGVFFNTGETTNNSIYILFTFISFFTFFLLHRFGTSSRQASGLYVNAFKTEYICYNQTGDISTLEGTPLKLVDKFTYLGSSVESTEKDIETRLTKAWTAINRLSIIWKSDLTDKMKRSFLQASCQIDTAISLLYLDANKTAGEETGWQLQKNAACNPERVLEAAPHLTPTVRSPAFFHENYSS